MYRWFIVYRYLFSRVISFAALMVVAASVALLLVIVSVMEGFRSELQRRVRGTSSEVKVESTRYLALRDPERVAEVIERVPGVRATAPFVETLVLYRLGRSGLLDREDLEERYLRVVDLERELEVGELASYVARGADLPLKGWPEDWPRSAAVLLSDEWKEVGLWEKLSEWQASMSSLPRGENLIPPPQDVKEVLPALVGLESLRREFLLPGQRIQLTAYSPRTNQPRTRECIVTGYFKTGLYELDSKGIVMAWPDGDEFLGLELTDGTRVASGVRVAASADRGEPDELRGLREDVERALEEAGIHFVRTQTWQEEKAPLLRAVQVEKTLVSVILGMIVIFSGFMIFIILTVQVVEKTRDLGVLQSMGVTPAGIASIYFKLGFVLCAAGTGIGLAYGFGFSLSVNTIQRWVKLLTGLEVFPATVFYMDEIPVAFEPFDLVVILVPTVVASLAASLIPAYRAARKDPVVALRYE
jgi:lipoprotein-releasing system permease protein